MFVRFLFFIIIISSSIFSAYLKNVPQSIIQPDGSIILTVPQKGAANGSRLA